jgi:hypothetical protein
VPELVTSRDRTWTSPVPTDYTPCNVEGSANLSLPHHRAEWSQKLKLERQ